MPHRSAQDMAGRVQPGEEQPLLGIDLLRHSVGRAERGGCICVWAGADELPEMQHLAVGVGAGGADFEASGGVADGTGVGGLAAALWVEDRGWGDDDGGAGGDGVFEERLAGLREGGEGGYGSDGCLEFVKGGVGVEGEVRAGDGGCL